MKVKPLTKEMFYDEVKSYITNQESLDLIEKAYQFAYQKHDGQLRKSGEPYFVHVLNVGYELAKLKVSPETIAAGLLHDVIEDCDVTDEEFIALFGNDIYGMVEAVTKIGNLKFKDRKEYQAENHRKIFIAMAKDVRVILIKLVDRLHNMRTLEYQPPEKQQRIATETLEVYAPIAHRLGIAEIKNELEDLSFFYLDNERYREIAHLVEEKKSERDEAVKLMIEDISTILKMHNIKFRIFGRSKHLYSINKKMITKHKRFDEILDLLAIRIVTETELNCYEVLGYIHATYRPIPGRMKDYIAVPKMNMYQSLHTTIVGLGGRIFEVQIRTEEMDRVAERGVAAHWSYKEGKTDIHNQKEIIKELDWMKAFEENSENASDYMSSVTNDVFNANVYVMTPMGRVIDLPNGSCPIDFAYRIHTEIGNQTVGALVNGALVPLNTPLKTGDVVELKTNKNSMPSEDWLKFVKSSNAKRKIQSFLTKKEEETKAEHVKDGESMLREEMRRRNINQDEFFDREKFEKLYPLFSCSNYTDFMYGISCKSISCQGVIEKLVKTGKKEVDPALLAQIAEKNKQKHDNTLIPKSGVYVKGIDTMQISLAPCCTPVKGDEIIGLVTKGQGIKVHRADCINVQRPNLHRIDVYWDERYVESRKYEANIRVFSKDRSYLLTDMATTIAQFKASMTYINVTTNAEDLTATAHISIIVDSKEHLDNIMANLRKIESVISVERDNK